MSSYSSERSCGRLGGHSNDAVAAFYSGMAVVGFEVWTLTAARGATFLQIHADLLGADEAGSGCFLEDSKEHRSRYWWRSGFRV